MAPTPPPSIAKSGVDDNKTYIQQLKAVIYSLRAEVNSLETQHNEIDPQIATEKEKANQLAKYEDQNLRLLRETKCNQTLMDELKEQLARANLDLGGSATLVDLTAPTKSKRSLSVRSKPPTKIWKAPSESSSPRVG